MFKIPLSFLPNPWVIVGALVALAFATSTGAYFGYQYAWSTQQTTITEINNQRLFERNEWNTRVANLSIKSFEESQYFQNLRVTTVIEREKLVTQWKEVEKTKYVNSVCGEPIGLGIEATRMLNAVQEIRK